MDPVIVGIIGLSVLVALIFLRLPIGFAMMLVGFMGVGFLTTMDVGISLLGINPYATAASYAFSVVPLFILMGLLCFETGVITEVYHFLFRWCGHLPGGLAIATIGGCSAFAAVTGSSVASAATMSKIALPEMIKYKYDPKLATGSIAAGGTLGILIPPSIAFIIYGIITETSVGQLFIAGIVPGILLTFLFMFLIYFRARMNPSLAARGPIAKWKERLGVILGVWPVLMLFIIVMGGIYGGFFTPTEAGAVGVFIALLIGLIKRQLTWKRLISSIKETLNTTGMVFVILMGAMVFNYFIAMSRLPMVLADKVAALTLSPLLIFGLIMLLLLALGCVMDSMGILLLTMPVFFPLIIKLGFDPVWFGVVVVLNIEVGMITPPVGLNTYIVAGIAKDVPLFDVFRGTIPFCLVMIVCIVILSIFPQIALFLPTMMK